uniref:SMC hinge domain-containing protein n=1 Tax=Glossina brevipalpis TaxID=37001 RepID=A0A1A9WLW8_9MUSC
MQGSLESWVVWCDVAICAACQSLDSIIFDTEDTAEKCIDCLKCNSLGRDSIMFLEKINYLEPHSAPFQTPENVPSLYDLVHVNDKKFCFALRVTFVVSNLELGSHIAFGTKHYRVVPLDGEIIEISRLMSAGGIT